MATESLNDTTKRNEDEEVPLKDVILRIIEWCKYLLSKWVIIFIFGLIGAISGYFYARSQKTIYTATTTFVLEGSESGGGGLGQYAGIASMVGIDLGGGGGGIFQGDNIIQLYKSRTMIEKTLLSEADHDGKKLLLIDRYIEFNHLRELWSSKKELREIRFSPNSKFKMSGFTRLQDSILGTVVNDINKNYMNVIKPDKKLNIIRVDVRSKDELFAKVFNDQIVKNVNDFYIQTKTKRSLENVAILKQKTDSVRAVMNGAIYTAAQVSDATPNLNPTRQVQRVAPIQRSQFNAETNKAVLGELVKNLEMSKMALLKEKPLIQVVDQPVFPLFNERISKVKAVFVGGILLGFLTIGVLVFRKIIRRLLAS